MKKKFYIKTALGLFLAAALLSSCLKQPAAYNFTNDAPVADFALVAYKSAALQSATISKSASANTINAVITIGAQHDYTTASTVTTIIDAASMATAYGTTYTLLPASVYTATSLTVPVIPGIQQRIESDDALVGTPVTLGITLGAVSFTINTANFLALDQTKTYMIPLTISSVSGNNVVIDQFHTIYVKIVVGP